MKWLDRILRFFGTSRTRLRWLKGHPRAEGERAKGGGWLAALVPEGVPIWTVVMLAACAALFLVTIKASQSVTDGESGTAPIGQVLVHYGATYGPFELEDGQWWRLVTACFLHGGVLHIIMNAMALWAAGQVVEDRFGRGQFLVVYFVTGVVGYAVSTWWHGMMEFSVGASGAIFGLIGFVVGHVVRQRGKARDLKERFVPWLLYGVVFSFTPHVNWLAHFGGLASGFLLGLVIADKQNARRKLPPWVWNALGLLVVAAIVGAFVLASQAAPIDASQ